MVNKKITNKSHARQDGKYGFNLRLTVYIKNAVSHESPHITANVPCVNDAVLCAEQNC